MNSDEAVKQACAAMDGDKITPEQAREFMGQMGLLGYILLSTDAPPNEHFVTVEDFETDDVLGDIRWRLDDIRQTLLTRRSDDSSLYGLDEWSTPIVNIKSAITLVNKLVRARERPRQPDATVKFPHDWNYEDPENDMWVCKLCDTWIREDQNFNYDCPAAMASAKTATE